ncbi:MAG: hypothetical protein ABSB49_19915 [Polyangia bacterium]|jgi:hypothetical protein
MSVHNSLQHQGSIWKPRLPLILSATLLVVAACQTQSLGRSCSLGQAYESSQGAYSVTTSACQTGICVKPALQQGALLTTNTGPYCSSLCTSDADCQSGQIRDLSNPDDLRCKSGYVCAIPFGADSTGGGDLCCQKLCLCKDFIAISIGPVTPASCQEGADASCSASEQD